MRRRTVLSSVAAGALAGCLTDAAGLVEHDDVGAAAPDGATDVTPTFGSCPSFVQDVDRTVCWSSRGDAEVYLRPSTRRFVESAADDSVETVTFTLHNDTGEEVRLNPYRWLVHRRTDGGWTHVEPDGPAAEPLYVLGAGETYEWRLATTTHPSGNPEGGRDVVVDLPAEGTYAFSVNGWLGPVDASPHVEWVARFEYVRGDGA